MDDLLFDIICKKINGIRYENACFLLKKQFTLSKYRIIKKLKFKKRSMHYFTEFKNRDNKYRIAIINLNKLTYEIDDLISEFFIGKPRDWKSHEYIRRAFNVKDDYLIYIKSLFIKVSNDLENIENLKKKYNFYENNYTMTFNFHKILNYIKGKSVLDIGTNTAILPMLIKRKNPKLKVIGADIHSLEYFNTLAKSEKVDVKFIYLDILNYNFKQTERYDTVIFSNVLEHFPEKVNEEIIWKLLQTTKKRLIIVVPFEPFHMTRDHLQLFNEEKIEKLGLKFSNKKNIEVISYPPAQIMLIINKK